MIIETERLTLRQFRESDAADVYEYLQKPAVNCFASMELHSIEEAKEEMQRRAEETEYRTSMIGTSRVPAAVFGFLTRAWLCASKATDLQTWITRLFRSTSVHCRASSSPLLNPA